MSLATYNKKRNFKDTSEPDGTVAKATAGKTFVIQRHKASRLHYDFRLEVNGVLKSWAVPKGPSLNPTDKRLAMQVEDHPLAYGGFKGVIPEGNYGAGIVEIWDKGTYEPEEIENDLDKTIDRNIRNGMLKFSLKGKKLKGSFALVRIRGAESKNWLLIKHRDKYATEEPYSSEDDTADNSPINKWLMAQGSNDGDVSSQKLSVKKRGVSPKGVSSSGTSSTKKAVAGRAGAAVNVKSVAKKSKAATSKKSSSDKAGSTDKSVSKTPAKLVSSKNPSSGKTSSQKTSSQKTSSRKTSSQKTSSKPASSKKVSSKKAPGKK